MDPMRLLDNRTALAARCIRSMDRHGRDVVVTIAKMTYAVAADGSWSVPDDPAPIRLGNVPHDTARESSIRYPSDGAEEKPGTDVLLIGHVHPIAAGICEQAVVLRVGPIDKVLRVLGPRVWYQGVLRVVPGKPAALGPTPLLWENAFGGRDQATPEESLVDARNPVGRGFARDPSLLVGKAAPVIEDPRAPLDSPAPAVAGFGPIDTHWTPRAERVGTIDERWLRERAPVRPEDFDPRFYCCAPDDQWCAEPLAGDELVEVLGATPSGRWAFRLPRYRPRFASVVRHAQRGEEEREHETHLDTLLIDADAGRVELVWRLCVPLPRKTELLRWIRIYRDGDLPEDVTERIVARRMMEVDAWP